MDYIVVFFGIPHTEKCRVINQNNIFNNHLLKAVCNQPFSVLLARIFMVNSFPEDEFLCE